MIWVILLAWPTWRLLRGRWVPVGLPAPGRYDFATMTWEDGVTAEEVADAGVEFI